MRMGTFLSQSICGTHTWTLNIARAPRMFMDTDGKERLNIDGKIIGGPRGLGFLGGIGLRDGRASEDMKYTDGRAGGFDPHERIKDMDLDGIDAVFLYPSIGLFSGAITDPDLAWAMCRAYNRWLADYWHRTPIGSFPSPCSRCNRSIMPSPRCALPIRH